MPLIDFSSLRGRHSLGFEKITWTAIVVLSAGVRDIFDYFDQSFMPSQAHSQPTLPKSEFPGLMNFSIMILRTAL